MEKRHKTGGKKKESKNNEQKRWNIKEREERVGEGKNGEMKLNKKRTPVAKVWKKS